MSSANLNQLLDLLATTDLNNQTEEEMRIGTEFARQWPTHVDTLNEYRKKRSCGTCKYALMELFYDEPRATRDFFQRVWPHAGDQLEMAGSHARHTAPPHTSSAPRVRAGEVIDIDDTPEAYSALLQNLKDSRSRYAGLAVRELTPGRVRVYLY